MIGAEIKFTNNSKAVTKAKETAAYKNIGHALGSIRKDVRASMVSAKGPSKPGEPPHVHRGRLRGAILFSYDKEDESGVVGPKYMASERGGKGYGYPPLVGMIHEFGGTFPGKRQRRAPKGMTWAEYLRKPVKARVFPARPFMAPALERATVRMAGQWKSSITP